MLAGIPVTSVQLNIVSVAVNQHLPVVVGGYALGSPQ
jgi:hypothetical protein